MSDPDKIAHNTNFSISSGLFPRDKPSEIPWSTSWNNRVSVTNKAKQTQDREVDPGRRKKVNKEPQTLEMGKDNVLQGTSEAIYGVELEIFQPYLDRRRDAVEREFSRRGRGGSMSGFPLGSNNPHSLSLRGLRRLRSEDSGVIRPREGLAWFAGKLEKTESGRGKLRILLLGFLI